MFGKLKSIIQKKNFYGSSFPRIKHPNSYLKVIKVIPEKL
tara:strand:- start:457 stop:576 length:120 start_codon:yes stop_codon:yes gene_type:complete